MKDTEANIALIRHVTKRLDEFLYETNAECFDNIEQFEDAFTDFLRSKEGAA